MTFNHVIKPDPMPDDANLAVRVPVQTLGQSLDQRLWPLFHPDLSPLLKLPASQHRQLELLLAGDSAQLVNAA